jgi:DNA repair exonuclease SbcCD ATPase subunit
MPIEQIGAALGAVNTAIGIGKAVFDAKGAVEKATLNLQIAELMGSLAEAKLAIVDIQDRVREREQEIDALKDALTNKSKVAKRWDAYYDLNAKGEPEGDPYCMRCYEVDHKLVHVARASRIIEGATCPACKTKYDGNHAATIHPPQPQQ